MALPIPDGSLVPLMTTSIFSPHHAVSVDYPVTSLLRDNECGVHFKLESRYESLPLGPQGLIAVKGRDNMAESSFVTYSPCLKERKGFSINLTGNFLDDMKICSAYPGETTLSLVSFCAKDEWPPANVVYCISRYTRFFTRAGVKEYSHIYHLPHSELHGIHSLMQARSFDPTMLDPVPLWLNDMIELLLCNTDRAARYVQLKSMSMGLGRSVFRRVWKEPRGMSLEEGMKKLSTALSSSQLQRHDSKSTSGEPIADECLACLEEFKDSSTAEAVSLHCPKGHTICKDCLRKLCEKEGLADVKCPWCSVGLASERTKHFLQPNYLDMGAEFNNDPRYSAFENFERSCADLDRVHAEEDDTLVEASTAFHDMEADIFNLLIHPARELHQHKSDTDDFLHPFLLESCPESVIFQDTLRRCLHEDLGKREKVSTLYARYLTAIYASMEERCESTRPNIRHTWYDPELVDVVNNVPFRRGFIQYMHRTLSRILRSLHVRRCRNKPSLLGGLLGWDYECKNKDAFHKHGDRFFFKPSTENMQIYTWATAFALLGSA